MSPEILGIGATRREDPPCTGFMAQSAFTGRNPQLPGSSPGRCVKIGQFPSKRRQPSTIILHDCLIAAVPLRGRGHRKSLQ